MTVASSSQWVVARLESMPRFIDDAGCSRSPPSPNPIDVRPCRAATASMSSPRPRSSNVGAKQVSHPCDSFGVSPESITPAR